MKSLGQFAVLVALTWIAAGATWWIKGPPERLFHCDPASLKPGEVCLEDVKGQPGLLWIDARSRSKWQADGLPGSILWNLDPEEDMRVFEAEAAPRLLEASKVVVYCDDQNCGISHQVADRVRALDLAGEVVVLKGGFRALREAGMIKGSNPAP